MYHVKNLSCIQILYIQKGLYIILIDNFFYYDSYNRDMQNFIQ